MNDLKSLPPAQREIELAARLAVSRDSLVAFRSALLASPAVRDSGRLLAAPLVDDALRRASPWSARPLWGKLDFCAGLVSD